MLTVPFRKKLFFFEKIKKRFIKLFTFVNLIKTHEKTQTKRQRKSSKKFKLQKHHLAYCGRYQEITKHLLHSLSNILFSKKYFILKGTVLAFFGDPPLMKRWQSISLKRIYLRAAQKHGNLEGLVWFLPSFKNKIYKSFKKYNI